MAINLDIVNFPKDQLAWTKDGKKKVHTNKEYLISYRIWGWKAEVIDVEKIWETDDSKDVIKETLKATINDKVSATETLTRESAVSITDHKVNMTDTMSENKRTYNHHLAWRWLDDNHVNGEWYVQSTDHRRTEISGTETHSQTGNESYKERTNESSTSNSQLQTERSSKSDIEEVGHRDLERERATLRENVLMPLRENTIAIDFRRITSNYPKWDIIRNTILEYESKRGLDLDRVATVVIMNMFII